MGIVTEIGQFLPLQEGYGSNHPLSFIVAIAEAGLH